MQLIPIALVHPPRTPFNREVFFLRPINALPTGICIVHIIHIYTKSNIMEHIQNIIYCIGDGGEWIDIPSKLAKNRI